MIIRKTPQGLVVVRQPEHGHQTGLFASAWGNEEIAPLAERSTSIELASTHHDDGWGTWELHPTIDARTDQPFQFHALSPTEHLPLYRAGIERAAFIDPFAGILVSMHGAGLYNSRYGTFQLVELNLNDEERQLVDEFLSDMAALQSSLDHSLHISTTGHVSADPFVRDAYLRMQVWDRLSLQFLYFGAADGVISPLPLDKGVMGELACRHLGQMHIGLEPYPFIESTVVFPVDCVTIADRAYKSPEDFLEKIRNAPIGTIECKVSPVKV